MSSLPAHWSAECAALAADQPSAALPVIRAADLIPVLPDRDVWDMWPIAYADGRTACIEGRSWWFFLDAPRCDDPDDRHDLARIRLTSLGADGWRDHGDAFPDGFSPGNREWSGSAVLAGDDRTLTLYFTAAGRRGGGPRFEQRLFEAQGLFADGALRDWTAPQESVAADGVDYVVADEADAPAHGIKGFRDPGFFRDPADGRDYLLFVGSAGWTSERIDGVIGLARRDGGAWRLQRPLVDAVGVNSELERPHIVVRDGL